MSFKELVNLVVQLITSWQVIAVTIVVLFYLFLVSYAARVRRRIKSPSVGRRAPKIKKASPEESPAAAEKQLSEGGDDLGIEEEE